MTKALISMSAFKGRLTNVEACDVVSAALKKNQIQCRPLPVGDGGAGSIWTVQFGLGGKIVKLEASGPLSRKVTAKVLLLPDENHPEAAYIESSEVCGHSLVTEAERDPMRASSHGLGEIIRQVVDRWGTNLRKIYVGLGDSAISDMGMGMLTALGYQFIDEGGRPIWGNATGLRQIRSFKIPRDPKLEKIKFIVLCDVLNPLGGPNGSARTFAPQKGATQGQVMQIEQGMENFAALILKANGRKLRDEPMCGSAGGLAAGFRAFFNTELVHGARFLMDWIHFDRILADYEFLIVGEGRTDQQTFAGKAPLECMERAQRQGKKVVVLSGSLGEGHENLLRRHSVAGCYACGEKPNAKDALYDRALELFSDEEWVETLR